MKESKVDMLTTQYENFCMKKSETIFEMNSRFTSITNELRCLVIPKSWESKVNEITKAKDLKTVAMDELIGNLQTYELNKQQGTNMNEGKKERSVAMKTSQNDVTGEEDEMSYATRRFQKIIKKHEVFQKKASTSRAANANDLCHKCGKPGHFMKDCPARSRKLRTSDIAEGTRS
ncbi:hypothetical protein KY285_015949 [Solanum tuberosum]|nr:hypothetical protein KY285_015949 [Solanum tuberosum]